MLSLAVVLNYIRIKRRNSKLLPLFYFRNTSPLSRHLPGYSEDIPELYLTYT